MDETKEIHFMHEGCRFILHKESEEAIRWMKNNGWMEYRKKGFKVLAKSPKEAIEVFKDIKKAYGPNY